MDLIDSLNGHIPLAAAGTFIGLMNINSLITVWNEGVKYKAKIGVFVYDGQGFKKKHENSLKEKLKNRNFDSIDYYLSKPGREMGYSILNVSYYLIGMFSTPKKNKNENR